MSWLRRAWQWWRGHPPRVRAAASAAPERSEPPHPFELACGDVLLRQDGAEAWLAAHALLADSGLLVRALFFAPDAAGDVYLWAHRPPPLALPSVWWLRRVEGALLPASERLELDGALWRRRSALRLRVQEAGSELSALHGVLEVVEYGHADEVLLGVHGAHGAWWLRGEVLATHQYERLGRTASA